MKTKRIKFLEIEIEMEGLWWIGLLQEHGRLQIGDTAGYKPALLGKQSGRIGSQGIFE
ncbi:hypothetical protein [Pedosphaera parvula]|uniref:Uncharacterized protein n=1 Tax=Pedosphaera parvula (strain Ellin514) TaxID=320771 RepID=B9XLR0_PEDPL|nr:hypothetical protein [Pedosphaera parvula]EEF59167.1 hypothetical protein Cflav_PD2372 [Pedosphaera parvula Ellin514]